MMQPAPPENAHKEIPGNPSTAKSSKLALRTEADEDSLRVLSIEDWKFWLHNGYIVIKNAIARDQAQKTADLLGEFEDKDPQNPATWYTQARAEMQMKELAGTGMVEVYNNQHLWNNRQYQKVYDVEGSFASLSSNSQINSAVSRACSLGTAFFILIYPLFFQNFQSSIDRTLRESSVASVLSFLIELLAVDGLPGISLCSFLGIILILIVFY